MLSSALLLLALAVQQPTQQSAAAQAKPTVNASQQADTSKAKAKHARRSRPKAARNAGSLSLRGENIPACKAPAIGCAVRRTARRSRF